MSMRAISFEDLKLQMGVRSQREAFAFSLFPDGVPKGAITEVVGVGKTELALQLLSEYPETRVAWIEENFTLNPFGFVQRKIDLGRVLFVETVRDTCWAVLQALKSQIFAIVVVYAENLEMKDLRKIQLAAERSQAVVLWLTGAPHALWPVSLQVKVGRDADQLYGEVLRRRF